MMSLLRQSVIRSTQSASRVSARSYSSAPNAGPSMIERLQQAGSSFAKTAERSLGSYSEPIMYNLRVAGSFLKQVYISEKLAPPMHLKNWTDAYRQIWQDVSSHKWWTQTLPSGQWRSVALYGVEAIGIFSIGEMIGKRKIVGYRLNNRGKDLSH